MPLAQAKKKDPAISSGAFLKLLAQCLTLSRLNVRRGRTLGALLQTEFHFLTFGQGLETTALDGGMMHKDILAAVGGGGKAGKTVSNAIYPRIPLRSIRATDLSCHGIGA